MSDGCRKRCGFQAARDLRGAGVNADPNTLGCP
jgi:hypothetical protein